MRRPSIDPALIPPEYLGGTVVQDVLLGRSPLGALILRSAICFPGFLNVHLELFRGPTLDDEEWINLVTSTRDRPQQLAVVPEDGADVLDQRIRVECEYSDGRRELLVRWQGGANERCLSAEYWGVIPVDDLPVSLFVAWAALVVSNVDLPTQTLEELVRNPTRIWE